jgi:hypothetical protein
LIAIVALVVVVVAVPLLDDDRAPLAAFVVVITTIASATYSYVRVAITDEALRMRLGPWGWPTISRRLDDILRAEAIHVTPLRYGGWGHRFTLRTTGIIVRGGEGLRLHLTNGRRFVVTVEGAEQAARAINDLVGAA